MVAMVGTGVKIEAEQMERLKVLMAADRRSLGFLVRDAITMYLDSRRNEINELKRQKKKKAKAVPRIDSGTF
jgi:hypothetical protein